MNCPLKFFSQAAMTSFRNALTPTNHDLIPKKVQAQKLPDFLNRSYEAFCCFKSFEQLSSSID